MLAQQIAKKYARAIFELAKEKNLLDAAWEQFNALAQYLKEDSTLIDFMTAPQVNDTKKMALIKTVFENRLKKPFYDFLLVLIKKKRIKFLADIITELDDLIRQEKKLTMAVCLTARKLTDLERRKLIEKLERKTAHKIELQEKIDRKMIGGMTIILHNQIIDGSIKYNLSQLKNRLMKVKVH